MRHPSATAALLASAVIGGLGLVPGAAHAQSQSPEARAAWVKSCSHKNDLDYPCGHWQLIMRDGRKVAVPGAATSQIDAKGNEVHDTNTFAISADGRVMAYERKSDHRLVVQPVAGGPARTLPKAAVPKGFGTSDIGVYLSPNGDTVVIDYGDEPVRLPAKVITVATGKIATLPRGEGMAGFSGDGDEVLTRRYLSDNTLRLSAHRLGGGSIKATPPQLVANAPTLALAPDGRTVAVFTSGNADTKKRPRVRTYDLQTGQLTGGADLPLAPGVPPDLAWWGANGVLHATLGSDDVGEPAVIRELTVDPDSGAVKQTGRYTISKTRFLYVKAGE
ncbi:WD40 repeat domain-containing protein [Nonomuraea angiospora]|uniref:hypothetical protein n=1 Tax=Nonomuraea angiospora TaxID=46172 RepID=UPI0029AC78A8|nr:hypothetical protein [Nonomuraea angiospora]MDX3106543.1 hypothetical protein [Nonomuraea angiospora]